MPPLYAHSKLRLRAFSEPSTQSESEGRLEPGRYEVLERLRGEETGSDADYARVRAPDLADSDTWICTRWRDQHYAVVSEQIDRVAPKPIDWTDDPFSIPEGALVKLLDKFHPYHYTTRGARYPYPIEGVSLGQAPPYQNNCCTFVEAIVAGAWQAVHGSQAKWSARLHSLMMILTEDLFGPITAIADAGMGVELADPDAPPHPWTAIQGWTRGNRSGHTFLILDYDVESDRVLTLESNSAHKLDGVGFRNLGNLASQPGGRPPANWWTLDSMPTWEDLCANYVRRESAVLKVTDVGWARRSD